MIDKLSWFKFNPGDWMMGRIRKMPKDVQADFVALMCVYWNNGCKMTEDDAELEIGRDSLDHLVRFKIIKMSSAGIVIDFLIDQMVEIESDKDNKSNAGRMGNLKRWQPDLYKKVTIGELSLNEAENIAKESHPDRTPIAKGSQNIAEKNRKEEKRKEKNNKPPIPPFQEFQEYAIKKASETNIKIDPTKLKLKYEAWKEAGWETGKGNKIKNWKTTLLNTLSFLQPEQKNGHHHEDRKYKML